MALSDPVAVYTAASNLEAAFLRDALNSSGVNAFLIEDVSQVGVWMGGLIPEIHKPQVWVERVDADRARSVVADYERRVADRRQQRATPPTSETSISVVCEDCRGTALFAESQRGTVQQCPHCASYLDVVEGEQDEDWGEAEDAQDEA